MRTEAKVGDRYWSLVAPHWLELNESWDRGADTFISQIQRVPLQVQHLYAAHWCQSEVCNGGFYQFFHNSTGILAPEAVSGFQAIGAQELAVILEQAIAYFGIPYPRDRAARIALLPASTDRPRAKWDPFAALDDQFYNWLEPDHDRWDKLADSYASDA